MADFTLHLGVNMFSNKSFLDVCRELGWEARYNRHGMMDSLNNKDTVIALVGYRRYQLVLDFTHRNYAIQFMANMK